VHYWADVQSVHEFSCHDNIAPNAKCQRVLVLALCLVFVSSCLPGMRHWVQQSDTAGKCAVVLLGRNTVVCRSVCLSVGHDHEPCKTAEPIEMSFWDMHSGGPKEARIR